MLAALENEAYALFRGQRHRWSCPLFASIHRRWLAWEHGIPPRAGGYADQNPLLLRAFDSLRRAEVWAKHDGRPPKR